MCTRFVLVAVFLFASLRADENRIGPTGIPDADLKRMKASQLLDIVESSLKEGKLARAAAFLGTVKNRKKDKAEDSRFADISYRLALAYDEVDGQRSLMAGNNHVGLPQEEVDQKIDAFLERRRREREEKAAVELRVQTAETRVAELEKELAAVRASATAEAERLKKEQESAAKQQTDSSTAALTALRETQRKDMLDLQKAHADTIAALKQDSLREAGEKNTVITKLTASEATLKTEVDTLKARLEGANTAYTALAVKHTNLQKKFTTAMEEDRQASQQTGITHYIVKTRLKEGAQLPTEDLKPVIVKAPEPSQEKKE